MRLSAPARLFALAAILAGTAACAGGPTAPGTIVYPPDPTSGPRCLFNTAIAASSPSCVAGPEFVGAVYVADAFTPGGLTDGYPYTLATAMSLPLPQLALRRADGTTLAVPYLLVKWVPSDTSAIKVSERLDQTGMKAFVKATGTVSATFDRFSAPPITFRLVQ